MDLGHPAFSGTQGWRICVTKLSTNLGNCQKRKENDWEPNCYQAKVGDLGSLIVFFHSPEKAYLGQISFNKNQG